MNIMNEILDISKIINNIPENISLKFFYSFVLNSEKLASKYNEDNVWNMPVVSKIMRAL